MAGRVPISRVCRTWTYATRICMGALCCDMHTRRILMRTGADFQFLPRDAMLAGICRRRVSVFPSVGLSVTGRCSTETAKRIVSRKQRHTIPSWDSGFLSPKIPAKLR